MLKTNDLRRIGHVFLLFAILLPVAPAIPEARSSTGAPVRIAFHIRTFTGSETSPETVSDAVVEGAPGTDLTLDARTGNFTLKADLKTDLLSSGKVRIVAVFTTRRDVGVSGRGLPLVEEDLRKHTVEVALDGSESFVVLPFGRNSDGDNLWIDIEPLRTDHPSRTASGDLVPPKIQIANPGAGGWLRIQATKKPHRYNVRADFVKNGATIASHAEVCELGEAGLVPVHMADGDRTEIATLRFAVTGYERECPSDRIDVAFDILHGDRPVAWGWSGAGSSNTPLEYALGQTGKSLPGQADTLRLTITPIHEEFGT